MAIKNKIQTFINSQNLKGLNLAFFAIFTILSVLTLSVIINNSNERNISKSNASGPLTYYVSKNGNNTDGLSWVSAWNELNQINWAIVQPGATIVIDGGTTEMTYTTPLVVGKAGAAGLPITITRATEIGRNGKTIIDGQSNQLYLIVIDGKNHVTVRGLAPRNSKDSVIRVRNITAGVVVENNEVYTGPGTPGGNARGIDVRNSIGAATVTVRNNQITTPSTTTGQTDGIWSSGNNGVILEANNIIISNNDSTGHSDCIQSYIDTNITINRNWCWQNNNATDNHGFWLSDTLNGGTLLVTNNIIKMDNKQAAVTHWNENSTWTGGAKFYNNTIYGGLRALNLDFTPNSEALNNIIWPDAGGHGIYIANFTPATSKINNNLIYAPGANIANLNGSKTWTQWKALGYDLQGINADPLFIDLANRNFALQTASPAFDKGLTLAAVTTDFIGTLRPQGGAIDIGAYETLPNITATPTIAEPTMSPTVAPTSLPTPVPTNTPAPIPTNVPTPIIIKPIRIEAGGAQYTDANGFIWEADRGIPDGSVVNRGNIAIANTTNDRIYQTEHYGMTSAAYAVPNGKYTVRLHFAETYYNARNKRVFNVNVNGSAINDLDVYRQAGGKNKALVKSVTTFVSNGTLRITFIKKIDNPEINGIEIIPTP